MPYRVITVSTTAAKLLDMMPTRKEYSLQNQGSVTVYVGNTRDVGTSGTRKGREIGAGVIESANKQEDPELIKEEQYGIVSVGTCDVWVWEA